MVSLEKQVSLWIKMKYDMNKNWKQSQLHNTKHQHLLYCPKESCYISTEAELKWLGISEAQTRTAAIFHFSASCSEIVLAVAFESPLSTSFVVIQKSDYMVGRYTASLLQLDFHRTKSVWTPWLACEWL